NQYIDEDPDLRQRQDRAKKAGIATALAAGTAMAFNIGDVPAAGAIDNTVSTSSSKEGVQAFASSSIMKEPEVALPYLEEQIRAAEEALCNSQQPAYFAAGESTMMMADAAVAAPAAPKPAAPATTAAAPKPPATSATPAAAPKPAAATPATTAAAPKPAAPAAATTTPPKPATPATTAASAPKPAAPAPAAPKPAAKPAAKPQAPSLYRYSVKHWPDWVKSSKMAYKTAEPLVMKVSRDFSIQLDKKILPEVRKAEHRILGDEVGNVIDEARMTTFKTAKLGLKIFGKALPVAFDVANQIIKATPEVIKTGKQVYKTIDKQVIPEIKRDYKAVEKFVKTETPKAIKTSKQVYETSKQLYKAVEQDVLPAAIKAEKKLTPKINALEHRLVGDELANVIDKSVVATVKSGTRVAKSITKNAPAAFQATEKTAKVVYKTGRVVWENGKQVYKVGREVIPATYRVTRDTVIAVDRLGGEVALALDKKAPEVQKTLKKEIPRIQEMGSKTYKALDPAVTQLVESSVAITTDVVNLVEKSENKDEIKAAAALGLGTIAAVNAASSDDLSSYGRGGRSFRGARQFF
ncbi:MAG: hypothetical protein SGILL_003191, partial [Bacillariaceae sp.]